MATLRQGLVESTELRAWPLLAPLNGIGPSQQARAIRTVAGLFAHHPVNSDHGNMGTTCRLLCQSQGNEEKPWEIIQYDKKQEKSVAPGPMTKKFCYLLEANADEIFDRITRIVLFAKSENIAINYAKLAEDLRFWPRARNSWAEAFWQAPKKDKNVEESGS
ncbi:MAG: type I-E CRISPR-associated protein Cse2/CasB [Desulfovibrionaceae bacterium]|nr:type I-E CRISPR-associated protein Cse2/CasB [Desulfovibrionaceae bacterium]